MWYTLQWHDYLIYSICDWFCCTRCFSMENLWFSGAHHRWRIAVEKKLCFLEPGAIIYEGLIFLKVKKKSQWFIEIFL